MSGVLVASDGTLLVQTLSPKYINSTASGEDVFGTLRAESTGLESELTCVLKPGQGIWLPFGSSAIVTGVSRWRETLLVVEEDQSNQSKKSRQPSPPRRQTTPESSYISYSTLAPVLMMERVRKRLCSV